ncbi:AMP-binding protein [Butyrivibrio sp. MC2013]|uniref:AMP-binding protein n=1 Tax=Butyrivibrio sp. MC2013 TaxID=1280686 RepID=UPI000400EEEA|nr:AMP-binding protein [Butyrivibrio sp. MC2013]
MYFISEFAAKVAELKDSVAITDRDGKRSLTYGELDSLSSKIAHKLAVSGVLKGDSVIIILPRISEYIACEIALLKLGAVVVPLIPDYPQERVAYIQKDSGAKMLIREDFLEGIDSEDAVCDIVDAGDDERAMILYTSGSTGKPKGVVYTRSNVDAHITRMSPFLEEINPLVFAASATMSFCVTVMEYLCNLSLGAHVHMISDPVRSDAGLLASYYTDNHIRTGFISPRILKLFDYKGADLVRVLTASEKVVNIYSDDYEIYNCYGQSETIGIITKFRIDKLYDNTPIGKALTGADIVIIDGDGNELPDGDEGQICIIGNFPCEYNNLPDQTSQVFKKLPDGRTFIYSGDIGKKLPDGNVVYLNRNDWMIKIHGQRVEPGEIESVMNTVDGVTSSIVKAFDNDDGTMLLCGFYTESKPVDKAAIKKGLEDKLPHYMIPGVFVRMDAFPVNANGKIDRKSIKKPDFNQLMAAYEKPENEIEEKICQAMQKILKLGLVGRNDNFFELGGNSINAVNLCAECSVEGIAPQIVVIGQTPAGIAALISDKSFYSKPALEISHKVGDVYPLSTSQRYQNTVCTSLGTTIDVIDMTYYFKLSDTVDTDRLSAAVDKLVNDHPIYKSHIDIENNRLNVSHEEFHITRVEIPAGDFESYRSKRYTRVRDMRVDPLFEAELISLDDGSIYLFICICHLIYDGKSLENMLACISAYYNDQEGPVEEASIFDLIEYEGRVSQDSGLIEAARKVFEDNYKGLKKTEFFASEKKYATAFSMPILQNIKQSEIDDFLKRYSTSILTLMQLAMEITVNKVYGEKDFCYMNVHDGRGNSLLNNAHGVFAKAVFIRSGLGKYGSLKEYFEGIEKQYQKLVYYDILDTFDLVDKYPAIKSGLTVNYRNAPSMSLKLGDEKFRTDFLIEFFTVNKPFTDMDFMINRWPGDMGYTVSFASAKVSEEFARSFVGSFDEALTRIIKGEEDGIYRKD